MEFGTYPKSLSFRHGCPLAKLFLASDLMTLYDSDGAIHSSCSSTNLTQLADFVQKSRFACAPLGHLWPSTLGLQVLEQSVQLFTIEGEQVILASRRDLNA